LQRACRKPSNSATYACRAPPDLVDRLARALGAAVGDLLPAAAPPEPLPVLREQAERLFGTLLEKGDRETFLRLSWTASRSGIGRRWCCAISKAERRTRRRCCSGYPRPP
jgi:hypothetical protein